MSRQSRPHADFEPQTTACQHHWLAESTTRALSEELGPTVGCTVRRLHGEERAYHRLEMEAQTPLCVGTTSPSLVVLAEVEERKADWLSIDDKNGGIWQARAQRSALTSRGASNTRPAARRLRLHVNGLGDGTCCHRGTQLICSNHWVTFAGHTTMKSSSIDNDRILPRSQAMKPWHPPLQSFSDSSITRQKGKEVSSPTPRAASPTGRRR